MGPPPQCSGLYLVIGVNCNIFSFMLIRCSLVSNLGVLHRVAGAQHLVLEPRGTIPAYKRLGSNMQRRTIRIIACARWACAAGPDGDSRWSIYSVLKHTMCSNDHCTRIQKTRGSWDKRHSKSACSQRKGGKDGGV